MSGDSKVGYPPRSQARIMQVVVAGSLPARTSKLGVPAIAKSKSPTTFAKRQREQNKKRKANDKLNRRIDRKAQAERGPPPPQQPEAGEAQEG